MPPGQELNVEHIVGEWVEPTAHRVTPSRECDTDGESRRQLVAVVPALAISGRIQHLGTRERCCMSRYGQNATMNIVSW